MKRNITISKGVDITRQQVEIVERKGTGHPDTMCDTLCELASQVLSQHYLKKFKHVLHHNVDKGLLVAGMSKPKFGGGRVTKKIGITIAGRATTNVGRIKIPVEKLILSKAKKYIRENFRFLKPEHINFKIDIKPGAGNLQEVFERAKKSPLANDTSFGTAHAPLSPTEQLVLSVCDFINSRSFLKRFPAVGEDIKVMGYRKGKEVTLTVAMAFVDRYVKSMEHYIKIKEKIYDAILKYANKIKYKKIRKLYLDLNTLDDVSGKSVSDIYLTSTGTSAESGDDGQVGRGNRPGGLITPNRTMSLEATAGKNINHPGKLYQIMAMIIAERIANIKGVKQCSVKLLSEIGQPLDKPQVGDVRIVPEAKVNFDSVSRRAKSVVNKTFDELKNIQRGIIKGKYDLF